MNVNSLLFFVFPYVAIAIAIVGTVYRTVKQPFSVSSLSSQLLERRKLFWGSIPFHWGIVIILSVHLLAMVFPRSIIWWNSVELRRYILELSGLALGVWALVGLGVLLYRRLTSRKVRAVTTPIDLIVLVLLLDSVITGVITATTYRYGSYWFTAIFSPYLISIFTLQPNPLMINPLPLVTQLHVLNFFLLLAIFPFTRIVHIITYPLGYLIRPWQVVIHNRRNRPVENDNPYGLMG